MNTAVDAYVQDAVRPELRPVVAALRALMADAAPDAIEDFAYNMPVWRFKKIFAYLNANPTDITFSFVRGAAFDDPYRELKGKGKWARFIKIKRVEDMDEAILRFYIAQALERAER